MDVSRRLVDCNVAKRRIENIFLDLLATYIYTERWWRSNYKAGLTSSSKSPRQSLAKSVDARLFRVTDACSSIVKTLIFNWLIVEC